MAILVAKLYISNFYMQNNVSQMMEISKELIWRESRYSIDVISVKSKNRFWNEMWIDVVGKTFQECQLNIINQEFTIDKILGNLTIIDYAADFIDTMKLKGNK